jgi:hypothetical protein
MNTALLVVLIGIVAIAAVAVFIVVRKRRSETLRGRFGPEYERAVREYGGRPQAEKALERRTERTAQYKIRALSATELQRFSEEWRTTQAHFVDDPALAVREADHLGCEVMRTRGYPMADFDRRAEDLSVDHAPVVRNYRAAHQIAATEREGHAATEDLRQAMVYYRDLFEELLETEPAPARSA